ncbi:MAG TPA: serine/threonine protein kinase [Polyangiaceae bacterium]|nr:serine/threonine protein kinase [Polyangiaceae bacterium]
MAAPMSVRAERSSSRRRKGHDPLIGKVVAGRYRLESRIGEGGMGLVYRARHVLIDRVIALKLIRPDLRAETHLRAWMLREAKAANRVDHAHIIDIHDIGETEDGELYLVMEYLVGTPLSAELANGPMPIARSVDIVEQMCAALARAHDLGVVHRDLKSDNILLTERGGRKDYVKILDFGLAALKRDARLAPKGAVFGTPEYMSPEQARGEDATPSSDLYALGVLFFEMLTGQLPFRSNDRDTLLKMQQNQPPPRPRSLRPDVHPQGEEIALRLLAKGVKDRYRDAHHLQEDLKKLQRSLPSSQAWEVQVNDAPAAPPPPPPPQSAGVTEWANRAAIFTRMVSRAYSGKEAPSDVLSALSQTWDLAARASRLEGEVASLTRKLDALERRGRALRAEIGRKVEDLAQEESRVLREAASHGEDVARAEGELVQLERAAQSARAEADAVKQSGRGDPAIFERAGATAASVQAKTEELQRYKQRKQDREKTARSLRRQIEQLRGQLSRYAEALEEDLARGRNQVGERTREGLRYEKAFHEASGKLLRDLRDKPECRDLVNDILEDSSMADRSGGGEAPSSRMNERSSDRER